MYAIHWLLTNPLYSHHSTDSEVDTKHPQTRGGHHLNIQGETPATVCDTLGCNVHTHTRNEWPKWLCGEYECALVSIVRPLHDILYITIIDMQPATAQLESTKWYENGISALCGGWCCYRQVRRQWRHWRQSRGKHVASVGSQTVVTTALQIWRRCTSNICL